MTYYQLAKEKHERITWSANWSLSFFLSADNLWYQVWPASVVLHMGSCSLVIANKHMELYTGELLKVILNKELQELHEKFFFAAGGNGFMTFLRS
jgi:hypothetical protein